MPNLFFAEEELRFAKDAINLFAIDKDFTPTSKHWSDFLIHLELCFVKAERGCQDIKNSFQPFQGYYKKQRKDDPLLSYLKNARDAVEHDNTVIVDLEIISNQIVDYIELEITNVDGNKRKEKHPMYPSRIKLKTFKINGRSWNPPKFHLNKPLLCNKEPLEVAFLGIKFYDDFLKETKRKFIDRNC